MPDDNSSAARHRRFLNDAEIRANYDEPRKPRIIGYAAVFNTITNLNDMHSERIARGAFTKSIVTDDIRALINHDANYVLGRNKSGTLRLYEDDRGLRYEIDPPDTQPARDLLTLLKRGDISQSSFGFNILGISKPETIDGRIVHTITEAKLLMFHQSPTRHTRRLRLKYA